MSLVRSGYRVGQRRAPRVVIIEIGSWATSSLCLNIFKIHRIFYFSNQFFFSANKKRLLNNGSSIPSIAK